MNADQEIKIFRGKDENEARQKANQYAQQNRRILERVEPMLNESSGQGTAVRAVMRRELLLG